MNPTKPIKCKHCKTKFTPDRPFITWCSPECGVEIAKAKIVRAEELKAKKRRKEYRAAKEKQKSRRDWLGEAQAVFNAYCRERDKKAGYGCISCGTKANVQYAAGHYRTVGSSPELRFDEKNVHLQCNRRCNLELSGNIIQYRLGLIQRYGLEIVDYLEGPHEPKKYTIPELKSIKETYKQKLRALK